MDKKVVKPQVEYILINCLDSRESDIELMYMVWLKFYKKYVWSLDTIFLSNLWDLPQMDLISRIRRSFNQKWLYLPKSEEIRKKRRINECLWYAWIKSENYLSSYKNNIL